MEAVLVNCLIPSFTKIILTLDNTQVRGLGVSNLRARGVVVGGVSSDHDGGSGLENGQEVGGSLVERGDVDERSGSVLSEVVDSNRVLGVGDTRGGGDGLRGLCESAVESDLEGVSSGGRRGEFSGESEHCVLVRRLRGGACVTEYEYDLGTCFCPNPGDLSGQKTCLNGVQ